MRVREKLHVYLVTHTKNILMPPSIVCVDVDVTNGDACTDLIVMARQMYID